MTEAKGAEGAGDPRPELVREILERSQRLLEAFASRQRAAPPDAAGIPDPLHLQSTFASLAKAALSDPERLARTQREFWQRTMEIWQGVAERVWSAKAAPLAEPAPGDRRFSDPAWNTLVFDCIRQGYLAASDWMMQTVRRESESLPAEERAKAAFFARQFVDAVSPSNFAATNPVVLRETADSGGENLLRGLRNMLQDLDESTGELRIRMADPDAFRIGTDVACTPGKVVARNDLCELIQYEPATETVHRAPLLVVPPWINKYYILDLRPENSFIRFAVESGFTVFALSWVNPGPELRGKGFEDYLLEGPLAALDTIERATGEREVAVASLCLGGTLAASAAAHLAAKGEDRIRGALYMATLTDFSEPGDLGVFIDDATLEQLEARMEREGRMDARTMGTTFNMLRANDLVWSFVINNYLMGREPVPFDLLFWNADGTALPASMHSFYLRRFYRENLLAEPGGVTLAGTPIDLGSIRSPSFFVGAHDDHIAPWRSVWKGSRRFGGERRFVLSGSGHIAGVVNPPRGGPGGGGKYPRWTNDADADGPDAWLEGATRLEGSWWPEWRDWCAGLAGEQVPAREPGGGRCEALCDAPGEYVLGKP